MDIIDVIEKSNVLDLEEQGGLPIAIFNSSLISEKHTFQLRDKWRTNVDIKNIKNVPDLIVLHEIQNNYPQKGTWGVYEVKKSHIYAYRDTSHIYIRLASSSKEELDDIHKKLQEIFIAPELSAKQEININFWSYSSHGASLMTRDIDVPSWDEIKQNYSKEVRQELENLVHNYNPDAGKLILLHGPAGTGKTTIIRALSWMWKEEIEFHYVIDPETFFGSRPDYMMEVLMSSGNQMWDPHSGEYIKSDKWKLLIMEDTGELLMPDSKERSGQGLSRLLNAVDGFIGQGLKIIVLITTNEKLSRLHEAVSRPGRCGSNIEFKKLDEEDVINWYKHNKLEVPDSIKPSTIAQLYGRLNGQDEEDVTFGFR